MTVLSAPFVNDPLPWTESSRRAEPLPVMRRPVAWSG